MNHRLLGTFDYKEVIQSYLGDHREIRGYQSQLAQAAGCGSSFLSQVLNSHVHLTPDHASGLSDFWSLKEDETECFISLVHLARTNSRTYKTFLEKRIRELRARRSDIARRVKSERLQNHEDSLRYYSTWFMSAIHVATSVPKLASVAAISKRFLIPEAQVEDALATLEKIGMVEKHGHGWRALNNSYHLDRNSPLIGIHHTNWRQRAIASVQLRRSDALHYSVVHSMSADDFEKMKSMLLAFISDSKKFVETSAEEEIIAVGLDCFRV